MAELIEAVTGEAEIELRFSGRLFTVTATVFTYGGRGGDAVTVRQTYTFDPSRHAPAQAVWMVLGLALMRFREQDLLDRPRP